MITSNNIEAEAAGSYAWDSADPARSVQEIRRAVETEAQKAISWYWANKKWKGRLSRAIQFSAVLLTALAGIAPIAVQIVKNAGAWREFDSGPLASIMVALAAALIGLDRTFGFSSGWTRYVLTATTMTKLLHEFRLEWLALLAASSRPPTAEQRAALIQRAKDFLAAIQGMVLEETREWATEFQRNIAQMEKDLKTQLDALQAQVAQAIKEREAAARPGAIELTVNNADKTDGYTFEVLLEGPSGRSTEPVSHTNVWTRINAVPGHYKIAVFAKCKGAPVATSAVIELKPGEIAKPVVTLPPAG